MATIQDVIDWLEKQLESTEGTIYGMGNDPYPVQAAKNRLILDTQAKLRKIQKEAKNG